MDVYYFYCFGPAFALTVCALTDYDRTKDAQPESVQTMLRLLVGATPIGCILISFVFWYFYPLNTERVVQNIEQLKLMRENIKTSPPSGFSSRCSTPSSAVSPPASPLPPSACTSRDVDACDRVTDGALCCLTSKNEDSFTSSRKRGSSADVPAVSGVAGNIELVSTEVTWNSHALGSPVSHAKSTACTD